LSAQESAYETVFEDGELFHIGINLPSWFAEALCRDADPDIFFPATRSNNTTSEAAREICHACPVGWKRCAQWAIDHDQDDGTWGGLTAKQRDDVRKGYVSMEEAGGPEVGRKPGRKEGKPATGNGKRPGVPATTYAWSDEGRTLHILKEIHDSPRPGVWVTEFLCRRTTTQGRTATGYRNIPRRRLVYKRCPDCWRRNERNQRGE
jgi:WhiB family transcriptional regulator, redox-sensing transcriptional regulator